MFGLAPLPVSSSAQNNTMTTNTYQPKFYQQERFAWAVLGFIVLAVVLIVWLAPIEQTIGAAIKYVYVHVAFTRAGIYGFYLAGILGVLITFTAKKSLQAWTSKIGWVAFLLFLIGGLVSILAQQATWGGNPWFEPRNRMTLNILAMGMITLILADWVPWLRVRGLLYVVLAGFVAWSIPNTPLVLHPGDAIGSSTSTRIQWVFLLLTWLVIVLGIWIVWYWHGRSQKN